MQYMDRKASLRAASQRFVAPIQTAWARNALRDAALYIALAASSRLIRERWTMIRRRNIILIMTTALMGGSLVAFAQPSRRI